MRGFLRWSVVFGNLVALPYPLWANRPHTLRRGDFFCHLRQCNSKRATKPEVNDKIIEIYEHFCSNFHSSYKIDRKAILSQNLQFSNLARLVPNQTPAHEQNIRTVAQIRSSVACTCKAFPVYWPCANWSASKQGLLPEEERLPTNPSILKNPITPKRVSWLMRYGHVDCNWQEYQIFASKFLE